MKKKFIFYGFLSEILYISFYFIKQFALSKGIQVYYLKNDQIFGLTFVVLILLFLLYQGSYKLLSFRDVEFKHIFIFAIIFNLTLVFVWNLPSNDIFTLIYRSRIVSRYGQNPYIVPYANFSSDQFFAVLNNIWSDKTYVHGPLLIMIGAFLTKIAQDSLIANILVFKFVYSAVNVLGSLVVFRITKSKRSLFLYSWNPVILFELLLNNHLDFLMIMFLFLCLYFVKHSRNLSYLLLGFLALLASVYIKYFTAILMPIYVVFALRNLKDLKSRAIFILITSTTFLLTFLIFYFTFNGDIAMARLLTLSNSSTISPSMLKSNIVFCLGYLVVLSMVIFSRQIVVKSMVKWMSISFGMLLVFGMSLILPWYVTTFIALASLYVGFSKRAGILWVYSATLYSIFLYFIVR